MAPAALIRSRKAVSENAILTATMSSGSRLALRRFGFQGTVSTISSTVLCRSWRSAS
jgi:hypothetical protein